MNIALVGNPNCGKTTLYNAITGSNDKVGNWAGVTVDRRISPVKKRYIKPLSGIYIVDLPGAYSMDTYTSDEQEAVDFIKSHDVDCIINVIDINSLERSLKLTLELMEVGIPMVVAINKIDSANSILDDEKLEELLGVPVILIQANKKKGLKKLIDTAIESVEVKRG